MGSRVVSKGRGLGRIQQLMEQFPELPRHMGIKADYIREGVKHTPLLDEVGRAQKEGEADCPPLWIQPRHHQPVG